MYIKWKGRGCIKERKDERRQKQKGTLNETNLSKKNILVDDIGFLNIDPWGLSYKEVIPKKSKQDWMF